MRFLAWAVVVFAFWAGFYVLNVVSFGMMYAGAYVAIAAIAILVLFDKLVMSNPK